MVLVLENLPLPNAPCANDGNRLTTCFFVCVDCAELPPTKFDLNPNAPPYDWQ